MVWKISSSIKEQVDRFGVIIEKVIVPNGEEKNFSYLDFAKGVCILPITADKEIICLKQYRHAIKSWQWELPAGMIDKESDAPLETAKRELEEETGNKAVILAGFRKLLSFSRFNKRGNLFICSNRPHCYRATIGKQ
ncbi:8-oxo-dGTP pyrophosphatase MutT (NUDIX family) [Neobacillus sp. B4I6]|uniref:NUDIX domain-containing protein n=1 Tax=Neobacillus sp. B4I6 TaxID=3373925 RepID=UPI003D1AD976